MSPEPNVNRALAQNGMVKFTCQCGLGLEITKSVIWEKVGSKKPKIALVKP